MRLVLEEHFSPAIAEQLQHRGYDVVSVAERVAVARSPLRRRPDEDLIRWAHGENRVLVTENVCDFMPIHHGFLGRGEAHAGILFTSHRQFPRSADAIGTLVRALASFIDENTADGVRGDIAWL